MEDDENYNDDFIRNLVQLLPECSPSEDFVEKILQRIQRKSIFVRILDWVVEKQTILVLNMTNSVLNRTQRLIDDYNTLIPVEI